jgi:hypothetical protein
MSIKVNYTAELLSQADPRVGTLLTLDSVDINPFWDYNKYMMKQYETTGITRTFSYANKSWLLPFRVDGMNVIDAKRAEIAKCPSKEIAVELVKTLNSLAKTN